MSSYNYSLANDFPNHKVSSDRLTVEIQASAIITALDHIDTNGDVCTVFFKSNLSNGDKSILDQVVVAHSGDVLPDNKVQAVQLYANDTQAVPTSSDGKLNFLPNLFPISYLLCFTGAGDDATLGVGKGSLFTNSSNDITAADHTITFNFNDVIYIGGGYISFSGAQSGDYMNYSLYSPATSVTSTPGTGNCNVVAAKVIPAQANNGNSTVNLTTANIVPNRVGAGKFDMTEVDTGRGVISPNYSGTGAFDLYIVDVPLGQLAINLPLIGSGMTNLNVPAVIPKKVYPHWNHKVVVHNSGALSRTLSAGWILTVSRYKSI